MNKTLTAFSTLLLAFFAFGATASAAGEAVGDNSSLFELARPVFDAIVHGNYWLAAALGVILLTAAAKKYLPDAYGGRLVRSELGGMVTAFALAFAGALATTFAAPGATMTMLVLWAAVKIGFWAVGGFMALHKIATVLVKTKFWNEKMPAPIKALVALALSMIGSSAVAKAEKAGQDAVEAKPAEGPKAVVGDVGQI